MMDGNMHEAWQKLANKLDVDRPSVGRTVRVVESKKHIGKTGRVFWHGIDRYSEAYRYCSPAQAHLRDMAGRYGWRVGIDADGERFFIAADKVEVIEGGK